MDSTLPIDACSFSTGASDSKDDEIRHYQRIQRKIITLEDMAATGDLEEVQQNRARGEWSHGDCNHTILGTVYSFDDQTQHLYLHEKPFQNIIYFPEQKNKPQIQLSVGSPYQHFIGYLEVLVVADGQTYDAQMDQFGWYLKVKPRPDVIEEMVKCIASGSTVRVDIPNSYAKFNRRMACLSKFCEKTDTAISDLVMREIFGEGEFERLNQCFNFNRQEISSIVNEVGRELCLNPSQRHAIQEALSSHLHCIQGPPGTGKTQTLLGLSACFLKLIAARDVDPPLICVAAPSNDLVNHLETKLQEQVNATLLRIGKWNAKLQTRQDSNPTNRHHWMCHIPVENLAQKIASASILSGTTSAFGNEQTAETKREVAAVVIDEAAQDPEPDTIQVFEKLSKEGQGILIGDPRQLKPCIQSEHAKSAGAATSMMYRLENQPGEHVKPWQVLISYLSLQKHAVLYLRMFYKHGICVDSHSTFPSFDLLE